MKQDPTEVLGGVMGVCFVKQVVLREEERAQQETSLTQGSRAEKTLPVVRKSERKLNFRIY